MPRVYSQGSIEREMVIPFGVNCREQNGAKTHESRRILLYFYFIPKKDKNNVSRKTEHCIESVYVNMHVSRCRERDRTRDHNNLI